MRFPSMLSGGKRYTCVSQEFRRSQAQTGAEVRGKQERFLFLTLPGECRHGMFHTAVRESGKRPIFTNCGTPRSIALCLRRIRPMRVHGDRSATTGFGRRQKESRLDVLGGQCLAVAMKTKPNIVDATVAQKAIQLCGEALL